MNSNLDSNTKHRELHTFSSYGNGVFIVDYNQTTPRGPLTSGM